MSGKPFITEIKYKFYEINDFINFFRDALALISWFVFGLAVREIKKGTRQCPFSFISKSH
jgi:hypothetical protein